MRSRWVYYALFAFTSLFPGLAEAIDCSNLPTSFTGNEFPRGNFFSNFNNACYLIPFTTSGGQGSQGGDLNSTYNKLFYQVNPKLQIIILGTFPNTRFFSVTAYDSHGSTSQTINDDAIVPLTSSYINPYLPGVSFVDGQKYAVPINFGGTPGNLETGCMMTGYNVDVNGMDASQRHRGMDWNSDLSVFKANPAFPLHDVDTPQHTNPNTAGVLMVRNYIDITPGDSVYAIVRDVASGCAYPAAYAVNTLQAVSANPNVGNTWLDSTQADLHRVYEHSYLPRLCFAANPKNMLAWARGTEYVPGDDPAGSYVSALTPAGLPQTLAGAGRVMRIRFRLPTTPPTPCLGGCARSGNEQMRYLSLSFQSPGGHTLASMADRSFVQDANGNVTLIVGTGASIPPQVSAANGYTVLDLSAITGYQQLNSVYLRDILPAPTFNCAGAIVPYRTRVYTPAGGLMDEYLPVVDYPEPGGLPAVATPLVPANSCGVLPDGQAAKLPACTVETPKPINIINVTTQCPAQGCNSVVVQPQPPLTIVGGGFGEFPGNIPFAGISGYLEIADTTQGWDAGYTGDFCSVAISSWANNRIQLVANVNQYGICPMAAGDQLMVKVWNPQSLTSTYITVTVTAN